VQRGHIYKDHGAWFVQFYEAGKRVTRRLGSVEEYPTQRSVEPLAHELMRSVNASPSGVTLDEFLERQYLPDTARLKKSTHHGYVNVYKTHIAGRPEASLKMREYRTKEVQDLLDAIATRPLAAATLQHIKAFLSGAFRFAAISGVREGNPVRECRIPTHRKPTTETQAYSLDDIKRILMVLPLALKAAVAVAAFAGLRLAEMHGLDWNDYDGENINVERSAWRGHVDTVKTRASKNFVPVIPQLRAILDAYRSEGRMFPRALEHDGVRQIRPALQSIGLAWYGWHAFRRGIASNLFELGCDELTVARVLRHSRVQVTRDRYIKVRDAKLDDAMRRLSDALE
jgi:integrase